MADNNSFDLGRRVRPLDDWSARLFAPATQSSNGKEPFLYVDFQYVGNAKTENEKFRNIEFGVNLRKGGKEGKIIFRPSIVQFHALCQIIKDVASGEFKDDAGQVIDMIKLDSMSTYINGQKLNQPETEVMAVVGKDGEGVYIGIIQRGRDNVKFYFAPPRMTVLRDKTGNQLTNAYTSSLFARVRANLWRDHIDAILRHSYIDDGAELDKAKADKKAASGRAFGQRQQQQNNGGGNWNNNQQQSSAPAQSPGNFDNDIPW